MNINIFANKDRASRENSFAPTWSIHAEAVQLVWLMTVWSWVQFLLPPIFFRRNSSPDLFGVEFTLEKEFTEEK